MKTQSYSVAPQAGMDFSPKYVLMLYSTIWQTSETGFGRHLYFSSVKLPFYLFTNLYLSVCFFFCKKLPLVPITMKFISTRRVATSGLKPMS